MPRPLLATLLTALLLGTAVLANRLWAPTSAPEAPPPRLPSNWAWIQRTYPFYQADPLAYRAALDQRQALLQTASKTQPFGPWHPVGPTTIGGRMVDVAFDPVTPSTIYAAAATGGVFKSTDDGRTWTPIFDEQAVLTIGDLAVDPSDPQTLYVGTGEANGGHNNFAGGGIYKSRDGGQTWRFLGLAETTSIGRVLVDPANPQRVFAAAAGSYFAPTPDRGLYRSTDGGDSWTQVLFANDSTGVIDVVQRPDDPDVLLAATWERVRGPYRASLSGSGSGIYRSTDGGDSWERLGAEHGLPDPAAFAQPDGHVPFGRIGLALCRNQPDVMYALYTDGMSYLGLYRTDDGGDSWVDADPDKEVLAGTRGFSWYFGQVRVHPDDPDIVYVLDVEFMRSTDGGATWTFQGGRPDLHVDHHALAFHPDDPNRVIDGNDGGLSLSQDGGLTWTKVADLPVTQFYEIAFDPSDPAQLYGGTQDNGTIRTRSGDPDDWEQIFGGDGFYVLIDPTDPNRIYVEFQNGNLFRSEDGGGSFTPARTGILEGEKRNWSTPVVMDPSDAQVLYYGTTRVYRSTNGAVSWVPISPMLPRTPASNPLIGTITSIAVAPMDPAVIYAGTDDGTVWVTPDGGDTWQDVTRGLPQRWVTRLAVDPTDAQVVYVTFSGLKWKDPTPHVFRSTDQGATWVDISGNLPDVPVNALAIDPHYPQVLYLGTDVGTYVSLTGGDRWEPLGTGLPAVPVNDLKVIPDTRTILAGTHGRSMYQLDAAGVAAFLDDADEMPTSLTLEPAFPNPFTRQVSLRFRVPDGGPVRLAVFDLLGRRVATVFDGEVGTWPQRVIWDGRDDAGRPVAAGTYLARLTHHGPAGPRTATVQLTHVR